MDTSAEAWAVQVAVQRRLSGEERLDIAFDMSMFVRDLAVAGLRRDHPDWTEQELRLELLRRWFPSCSLPSHLLDCR